MMTSTTQEMSTESQFDREVATLAANNRALISCAGPHDFQPLYPDSEIRRCSKCGGTISPIAFAWYERGLNHGLQAKHQ